MNILQFSIRVLKTNFYSTTSTVILPLIRYILLSWTKWIATLCGQIWLHMLLMDNPATKFPYHLLKSSYTWPSSFLEKHEYYQGTHLAGIHLLMCEKEQRKKRDKWFYLPCKFFEWSEYLLEFFAFRNKYSVLQSGWLRLIVLDFINSEILRSILPKIMEWMETFCSEQLFYRCDVPRYLPNGNMVLIFIWKRWVSRVAYDK